MIQMTYTSVLSGLAVVSLLSLRLVHCGQSDATSAGCLLISVWLVFVTEKEILWSHGGFQNIRLV